MQLKTKPKPIRKTLAMATATLLGHVTHIGTANAESNPWEIDTAVMSYQENGRVSVLEPVIRMREDKGDDKFFTLKLVVDTLSGASPNGAIPTNSPQTFSGPSGSSSYPIAANTVPLDPNFHDTRYAINAEWEQPAGDARHSIYGLSFSTETDYQSLGASATYNFDFNNKNTTLTTGASFSGDSVQPLGGKPVAFAVVPASTGGGGGGGEDEGGGGGETSFHVNKRVVDLLLGVTQVMGRKDLIQLNFNYGKESGYLNDPYKLLSVVDNTGALITAVAPDSPYIYEKRPDSRNRTALYSRWSHQFGSDVLRLSYRYYSDSWGIRSNTLDMHYRLELGERFFLEPHLRSYKQTAADFYHTSLLNTEVATLDYASADYRLADMTTKTVGLKFGWLVGKHSEAGIRVETITQQAQPSRVIGIQSQQDLLPTVKATMVQLNYRFLF